MPIPDQVLADMVQTIVEADLHPDDELLILSIVMGDINAEEAEEAMAETVVGQAIQAFTPVQQELAALDGENKRLRQELTRRVQPLTAPQGQQQSRVAPAPAAQQQAPPVATPQVAPAQQVAPVVTPQPAAPVLTNPPAPQVQPVQPQVTQASGVDDATWFAMAEEAAEKFKIILTDEDRRHLRMYDHREEKNARQWACKIRLWQEHQKAGGRGIRKDFGSKAWQVIDGVKTLAAAIAEIQQVLTDTVPQAPAPAAPVTTQSGPSVGPNNPVEGPLMATDLDPKIKRQACQEIAAIAQACGVSAADMAGKYANDIQFHATLVARERQARNDAAAEMWCTHARTFFANPAPTTPIEINEEDKS